MPTIARTGTVPVRRFAAWAIGPWMILLLAGLGFVQYLRQAQYLYLVAALAVIAVSAGCILRQAWARDAMRVLAVLLALGALYSLMLDVTHWGDFERARRHVLAQSPALAELGLWMIDRAQRIREVSVAIKVVAMPLLLWLAWALGRPAVRPQFRTRRR